MNKKLLLLLPAAALLLAGCTGNGGDTSSSSSSSSHSSSSTTNPYDEKDYGTLEAPLTVAQWKTNVAKLVPATDGEFSAYPFYVKGISEGTYALGGNGNIFLHDDLASDDSCKIINAVDGTGGSGTSVYQNDEVVAVGYAEYYNNIYSLYKFTGGDPEKPTVKSIKRGASTFSASVGEHVSISSPTSFEESYVNLTEIAVKVVADEGYDPVVKVNNAVVAAGTDGSYKVVVKGNTTLSVSSELHVEREDLPAGTYSFKITYDNAGLASEYGSDPSVRSFTLKEDADGHYYKKLAVTFSANVRSNPNASYKELDFNNNSKGNALISAPNGTISKVTIDFYKYINLSVYAGSDATGTAITGTEAATQESGFTYDYAVNNANAYVNNGSTYSNSIYSINVTVVVA